MCCNFVVINTWVSSDVIIYVSFRMYLKQIFFLQLCECKLGFCIKSESDLITNCVSFKEVP